MVHFVGAGPGAPDLITQRGAALLQGADCIIYSEPAGGTAKFSYLLDADDPTALINRTTLEIQVEHIN